jgi:hypothetical protein
MSVGSPFRGHDHLSSRQPVDLRFSFIRIVLWRRSPVNRIGVKSLSSGEVVFTIVSTLVGAILGVATSHYYFRRGLSTGPQLVVGLEERARLDHATVGTELRVRVGRLEVKNLVVLEIVVGNPGSGDLDIGDPDSEEQHPKRPRIELPEGLRALADPWNPDGVETRADVRVARQLRKEIDRQVLYIHVRTLAAGETVRTTVLCSYEQLPTPPALTAADFRFFPGIRTGFTTGATGLLKSAPLLRS